MSWELVKLKDVAEVIAGQSPESKYYNNHKEGIPFFQGKADFGDQFPTVRYWCTNPTKISAINDILLSVRAPVGPTNISNTEACIGRGLAAIRVGAKLYYKYLYYYFKTIESELAAKGNGSTFSAITTSDVKELRIPLPPLPIQKRIAEILDAAVALRRKDQELLNKYDELAQAIFIDMFGDPVKNEKRWEVKRLNEVCLNIYGGGTPSKSNPEFYVGNIPWVTPKDMKSDMINDSIDHINELAIEKSSTRIIPKNSVLMVIRSGILKHTLPVAINTEAVAINQDMKAFIPNYRYTNEYFLRYFLAGSADFLLGKVRAVTADNIEFQQIRSMEFICPPMKLQESFKHKIKILMNIRSKNSIFWGETLFQAVLYGAFRNGL